MKNDTQKDFKSQVKKTTGEILDDGKRSWRKCKLQSLAISHAYSLLSEFGKYESKIAECGSYLKFKSCPKNHQKRLISAGFCRCRLCVMCQWRRSLVIYAQVIQLVHAHKNCFKSDIPLLLTLTVPNVSSERLVDSLNNMQK